ncbi:MAG: peroxiredoxin [Chthoniobacterales bacterium]|nr:peroxiredoxin [Chthoniobacterales bacterium]
MNHSLQPGDSAPDFTSVAVGAEYGDGKEVRLSDFSGRRLVLYFYPKDDTPGCTTQACGIRDNWSQVASLDALVFGVSADDAASHRKFIDKFDLPFPLLSDTDQRMVKDYGVWVEKVKEGKTSMGIERSTFVIGPDGRLEHVLRQVAPAEHLDLLKSALA